MVGPSSVRILIVDKSAEMGGKLASALKKGDYVCFTAGGNDEAITTLEREQIQLVVIVHRNQDKDTLPFLKEITKNKPDAGKILMFDDSGDFSEDLGNEADNVIFSPFNESVLRHIIEYTHEKHTRILQTRKRLDEFERSLENSKMEIGQFNNVLEQNFIDTIKTFVGLLETRDQHLGSHSKRVATFSRALVEMYDLNERVKRDIEIGALLHDIGKMGISDLILMKTQNYFSKTQLTNKERSIYQKHPIVGYEAVEMINMLSNVGDYIRFHHERFDGTGYPDGLTGFYIPLGARIIGVVDVYEKIVFSVDKRKHVEAEMLFLKFLEKHKGKIFDPEAADNMTAYIHEVKNKEYSSERRVSVADLTPGMILARDLNSKSGVLVISQFEKITGSDVERITRFLAADMIIDGVYVYEAAGTTVSPSKRRKKSRVETAPIDNGDTALSFETVCESLNNLKSLTTLPEVHESFIEYLTDAKSSREDTANIIKWDPVVALSVLRIANSPLFGLANKVTTIDEAYSMLGYNEIRNIIMRIEVFPVHDYDADSFNRLEFWKHQCGCASICRIIGQHIDAKKIEEYYIAGLFHDVGKLVLDQLYPDRLRKVIQMVNKESVFYRKAERLEFGKTHVEIGEYFLNLWNIPDIIKDAVRNHHSPMDSTIDPTLTSAVHLADIIAHLIHIGQSGEKSVPKLESFAEQKLSISLSNLESLLPEIDEDVKRGQDILFR